MAIIRSRVLGLSRERESARRWRLSWRACSLGETLYAARTFVDHSGRRLMWVSTISCTRKSAEGRRMGAPPTI